MTVDAELTKRHVGVLTATQIPVVDATGNDSMMYGKQWLPAVISPKSPTEKTPGHQEEDQDQGGLVLPRIRRRRVPLDSDARVPVLLSGLGLVAVRP